MRDDTMKAAMKLSQTGFFSVTTMIKNVRVGFVLVVAIALSMFLAATVDAQQTKQTSKSTTPAKKKVSKETAPPVQMKLEPKAMEILKAACDRLAAAKSMSFAAVVTEENPSRLGIPLAYTTKSDVILQRPDKLRVITSADGPASEFYYNGKTMVAFAPAENLVAIAEAPPTIDAALKVAYNSAAIYYPFTDVMVADPYKGITDGLMTAFYIGQSKVVAGTTTDMVAYADKDVFVQIWIGAEDKLPRMARAVYRNDPSHLRHQVEFSNWKLDIDVSPDAFGSASAANAKPIVFAHPNPKPPAGTKPPTKGKTTKSK
jgi:hypothetical protein